MFLGWLRRPRLRVEWNAWEAWISWAMVEAWAPDTGPSSEASAQLSEAEARALFEADLARYGQRP